MNHDCSTKAAFLCTVVKLQSCHMLAHWIQHTEPSPPFNQHSLENKVWMFYEVLSIENNPWAGLGRILAVACATTEKHWCLQRPACWEGLPERTCKNYLPLAKTRMSTHGSNLDCTTSLLRQAWEELVPWERTPWHKFRPSWIMTLPQRLCFSAQQSNCKLATCWHIEFSILSLPHLSISIHLRIRIGCSMKFFRLKITLGLACMKFFRLKITLGLALGESWPLLAQPQKNTDVYKGMLPWEGFPRQTCKNYLRRKQGCLSCGVARAW